jgi:hypothetical protein
MTSREILSPTVPDTGTVGGARGSLQPHDQNEPERALLDTQTSLMDKAASTLLVHVAGHGGLCAGCFDWGRFALVPCPVARRALPVLETHGVAVWDARPGAPGDGESGGASLIPSTPVGCHSRGASV